MKTTDKILKVVVVGGFLVAIYFLIKWIIGDIGIKPIGEFTLGDISNLFIAGLIFYVTYGGIANVLNKHD